MGNTVVGPVTWVTMVTAGDDTLDVWRDSRGLYAASMRDRRALEAGKQFITGGLPRAELSALLKVMGAVKLHNGKPWE